MFSHMVIGSNDLARSKTFYDALFAAVGGEPGTTDALGRLVYAHRGSRFVITRPINGEAATAANGGTIGFAMDGPDQASAWHEAGVTHGGTSVENPPGERRTPMGRIYLAYLRDPDGNKLCARYKFAD
ncbi:glyoxalase [Methylobacterium sp. Leaf104]|uniref:VOC family protein n=1 Tax=Methylobacterium TaxID=407 RepID=UPI0006FD5DD1|nr:VOC family protein [Methylobacterium sp. Leaf104]KQP33870.1 glyoxalase [Methylobacterium sp. Leaf104]MCI9879550.1 VOC family protein [Methylobacterium goesingense]